MDDDNFELVPIAELKRLRKENKQLAMQIAQANATKVDFDLVNELAKAIHEEGARERATISKLLMEIKDLNKSTLNNVIHKAEKLEIKLEDMIDTLVQLTNTIASESGNEILAAKEGGKQVEIKKKPAITRIEMDMFMDKIDEMNDKLDKLKLEFVPEDSEEDDNEESEDEDDKNEKEDQNKDPAQHLLDNSGHLTGEAESEEGDEELDPDVKAAIEAETGVTITSEDLESDGSGISEDEIEETPAEMPDDELPTQDSETQEQSEELPPSPEEAAESPPGPEVESPASNSQPPAPETKPVAE